MVDNGVVCSMSRSGNVWDNAAMKGFFSSLKTERIGKNFYRTRDAASGACGVDDRVVVFKDGVCEPVLAEVLPDVLDRVQILNALPKPPGINDLYASQAEVRQLVRTPN